MSTPPRVLVCFAVQDERRFFTRTGSGQALPDILLTGIGRQAAQAAIEGTLRLSQPAAVITSGFAGGLNPGLARGTVILEADPGFPLWKRLLAAGAKPGQFHCAERVVGTVSEKAQLWARTGADAVEMESHWLHQSCRNRSVPCATVRVILDIAHEDLPLDFNLLSGVDGKISARKLTLALAKAPHRIPALIRLGRHAREASRQLGLVLERVF